MTTVVRTQRQTVVAPTGATETVVRSGGGGAPGAKGDPGGNVMAVGLFTALAAISIPLGTDVVRSSGYSVKGVGISDYVADAAVDSSYAAAHPRSSFVSANSRGFRLASHGYKHVESFGALGDGTTDDTSAIAAAVAGGGLVLLSDRGHKASAYIPTPNDTSILGTRNKTKITCTHAGGGGANASENLRNGSLFVSANPINSSTAANINVSGVWLENTNGSNVGAGFYDTGGSFCFWTNCKVTGFAYGWAFNQTESSHVDAFEASAQLLAGLFIANGDELTPSAAAQFANQLTFTRGQINQLSTVIGIVDNGGTAHAFGDININGCSYHCRFAGVEGLKFRGAMELEASALASVLFEYRRLSDLGGVGQCSGVAFEGGFVTPGSGLAAVLINSVGDISFDGGWQASTTATAIQGCVNAALLKTGSARNRGGGALRDANATATVDLFKSTNILSASPFEIYQIIAEGPTGGWVGAIAARVSFNGGALFDALRINATTTAGVADGIFAGAFQATSFKVGGNQVVGSRRTGWTAATGTPSRGAFAAAAAGTASGAYVQAELQGALNRIAALEARLIALEADDRAHGLIDG